LKPKMFIFGSSSFAEIAGAYFLRSQEFDLVGYVVDSEYKNGNSVGDLPLLASGTREAEQIIQNSNYFYVAATYTKLNRFRSEKYLEFKSLGIKPASYISPESFIDPSVSIGEHVFIFEGNVIQYGAKIGDNCLLWSGNHVGHHSIVCDNVFVSSHVVISGHCTVGKNSFLGVNSTVYNNVEIGEDNWIGPNSVVAKSTSNNLMMRAEPTKPSTLETKKFFKIEE
jgi:sugar O-acyltransferase (sialic acid O-acetyltransferase NeuD family)